MRATVKQAGVYLSVHRRQSGWDGVGSVRGRPGREGNLNTGTLEVRSCKRSLYGTGGVRRGVR